ncbi:MAG: amino acid permease [Planctomycetota bacterium]
MDEERLKPAEHDRDAAELERFGYAQQLRRTMGAFSSFAISFSLVSIITGIFANLTFGYRQMGPAVIWSWILVAVGQFLVALVLADLASRIPLSGYGYQWSTRLVNAHFGYFVGWLLLMQFLTGFPGVCHTLATALCAWFLGNDAAAEWIPWVAVGVVSVTALLHLFGIRLVSLVNDAGVVAELLGAAVITVALLAIHAYRGSPSLSHFLENVREIDGVGAGLSAFALSLLMGAWCLTGFEAAADLAEEIHQPKRVVPRVILTAALSSSVAGALFLAGLILCVRDPREAFRQENLVVSVLEESLGNTWMPLVMLVVAISIFACGVASMAATTRLVFSLARDNMLPFSHPLKRVHPRWQTPAGAIVLVWLVSTAVILGFRRLEIITSVSAAAGYLGYMGIIAAAFRARGDAEGFSLRGMQFAVRAAAFVWVTIIVAALTIPEADSSPNAISRLPAKSTFAACAVGAGIYWTIIRGRIRRGEAGPPRAGAIDEA